MMKTQAMPSLRSTSNSTESLRLKKSTSSQFANKMKSSLSQLTNPLESSLKPNRINTSSKSNKKTALLGNNSNKSLKTLNETHSQSRLENNRRPVPRKIEAHGHPERKGAAVNVKNMKQKALGHCNPGMVSSYKAQTTHTEEKENDHFPKKFGQHSNVDKKMFVPETQPRRSNRQSTDQSLFNFSTMLAPR